MTLNTWPLHTVCPVLSLVEFPVIFADPEPLYPHLQLYQVPMRPATPKIEAKGWSNSARQAPPTPAPSWSHQQLSPTHLVSEGHRTVSPSSWIPLLFPDASAQRVWTGSVVCFWSCLDRSNPMHQKQMENTPHHAYSTFLNNIYPTKPTNYAFVFSNWPLASKLWGEGVPHFYTLWAKRSFPVITLNALGPFSTQSILTTFLPRLTTTATYPCSECSRFHRK